MNKVCTLVFVALILAAGCARPGPQYATSRDSRHMTSSRATPSGTASEVSPPQPTSVDEVSPPDGTTGQVDLADVVSMERETGIAFTPPANWKRTASEYSLDYRGPDGRTLLRIETSSGKDAEAVIDQQARSLLEDGARPQRQLRDGMTVISVQRDGNRLTVASTNGPSCLVANVTGDLDANARVLGRFFSSWKKM